MKCECIDTPVSFVSSIKEFRVVRNVGFIYQSRKKKRNTKMLLVIKSKQINIALVITI